MKEKLSRAMELRGKSEKINYGKYRTGLISSSILTYDIFNNRRFYRKIGTILKQLFLTPEFTSLPTKSSILYSIDRADYQEIINLVSDKIYPETKGTATLFISLKNRISSPKEILSSINPIRNTAYSRRLPGVSLFRSVTLNAYLMKGLDALEKSQPNPKGRYTFFNSSSFPESLLCEYYRKNGCDTASLQHGLYLKPKTAQFDVINLSNIMAEKIFCWGEASKQAIEWIYQQYKLEKKFQVLLCGYPKETTTNPHLENKDSILLLLPRSKFITDIVNLMNIIKKTKTLNFSAKLHPSLVDNSTMKELLHSCNIELEELSVHQIKNKYHYKGIIGFNTTALFELIKNADAIAHYESKNSEYYSNHLNNFSTAEQLEEIMHSKASTANFRAELYEYYLGAQNPHNYLPRPAQKTHKLPPQTTTSINNDYYRENDG